MSPAYKDESVLPLFSGRSRPGGLGKLDPTSESVSSPLVASFSLARSTDRETKTNTSLSAPPANSPIRVSRTDQDCGPRLRKHPSGSHGVRGGVRRAAEGARTLHRGRRTRGFFFFFFFFSRRGFSVSHRRRRRRFFSPRWRPRLEQLLALAVFAHGVRDGVCSPYRCGC